MVAELQGIGDVADLAPLLVAIVKYAIAAWLAALVIFWRVTIILRKRAYGPGQGRRYVPEAQP